MNVVTSIALTMLAASGGLCLLRQLRSRMSLADRLVGLDTLLLVIATGVAVWSARTDDGVYLDVMVVVSLVSFTASVTVALFIERRGSR